MRKLLALLTSVPFICFAHTQITPLNITTIAKQSIQPTYSNTKLFVHNATDDWTAVGIDTPTGYTMCSGRAGHYTGPGRHDDAVYWSGFFSIEKMCRKHFPCIAKVFMSPASNATAKTCGGAVKTVATLYSTGYASFSPQTFKVGGKDVHVSNPSAYHFTISE